MKHRITTTMMGCLLGAAVAGGMAVAGEPAGDPAVVRATPGLVAFWTFGEEAGRPRLSQGTTAASGCGFRTRNSAGSTSAAPTPG